MDSPSVAFDLSNASAQFYRRWAQYYVVVVGVLMILLSLPYTVPISLHILSGRQLTQATLMVYLAIVGVAYPLAAFVLLMAIVRGAPRPVRMILANDTIWLDSASGRRSRIDWADRRIRLNLLDQSGYAIRTGADPSFGYRIGGVLGFRAILTHEAFDALLTEARSRGLSVTCGRPSRWSVAAATPGTVVYRIRPAPNL
jgi:hypothetical protein